MAKKKQFVTAAAAFAVAASAVAPAITADAATQTVRLKTDYVRSANLDAVLDQEYKGSEIHWYKSSIDLNKLGVFQTAKGFVKGKGIKVEKSLRVLNYVKEVQPAKEIVLEQGVPASGLRIQPVLFADGNLYNKPVSVSGFNTDKVGEFEGQFTYANKAFGSVTTKVKYKVVATKVELTEVKSSVNDDVLSVTADVKNLKDGEKVELVIYAGRDVNAALTPVQAEVKDGKLSVKSGKLPAGNHSFILRSGEVKTEVMNFVVEAPMVKEVKAINLKQVEVKFNKELNATDAETAANFLYDGATVVGTPVLKDDKKTVVITLTNAAADKTAHTLKVQNVKTADGKSTITSDVMSFFTTDTVKPEVLSSSVLANGNVEVTFSEPLKDAPTVVRVNGIPVSATFTAGQNKVTIPAAQIASVGEGATATLYIGGAKDFANLESKIFEGSFVKLVDKVKPVVSSIKQSANQTFQITFSEELGTDKLAAADITLIDKNGVTLTSGTQYTVSAATINGVPSDKVFDVVVSSDLYASNSLNSHALTLVLKANNVNDVAGNVNDVYSSAVTLVRDQAAPQFVSTTVASNKETIEVKFDKAVTPTTGAASKIIVTNKDGVRFTVDSATQKSTSGEDAKVLVIDLIASGVTQQAMANGEYTLQFQAGVVADALNNQSSAFTTKAVVGDSSDTTAPVATLAGTSTANNFVINFGEEVTSTALSASNYMLDNKALPAGTAIYFTSSAKNQVKIELPENSINIGSGSGTAAILNVANVKDVAGNVADTKNLSVLVKDNTPAVLTSAQKLGNTLVLTFNENLGVSADDANLAAVLANYEIKSGSNTVVATGTTPGVATASLVAGSNNKVQITFSTVGDSLYNAAETITVKTNSLTGDVADANGVRVKGGVTVTAN